MSASIGVLRGNSLTLIDEITKGHDTDSVAKEIIRRYPNRQVYVYPDSSGGSRSTNAAQTDVEILSSYGFSNQSPRANPPVRDRVMALQAALMNGKGETKIKVLKSCTKIIECFELQSYNDRGEPDKDAGYDHLNDATGYLCWRLFNPLYARAGRGTGIRIY